ncbi:FLYWCH-type zinc finger-containing protein 1, partial [Dissostichus eleginoides]
MALLVSSLKRRTSPENENGGKKTAELHGLLLLENIKQQVNQLAGTLNILMAKVGSGLHAPTYEMPEEFQFPLDSDGELERFEEWLRNPLNERMKTDLATSLSSVGGVDTKRVVWNILARMITCTVARRINWKGVNGKRAFSKMAMKIVLFRAVRKCAITSAAMDADISQHTIRWFNLASDREGGRQERRRQSQDTLPRIRITSGTRVRTGSGTRRTILKQSWTNAGPYLPQIRFADPIQFRADVRLDNGPSPFGGSGPDRLLGAAQIRPS